MARNAKRKRPQAPTKRQSEQPRTASVPLRSVARVIDWLVLSVAWAPVGFIAARTIAEDGNLYGSGVRAQLIAIGLNCAYILYEVGLIAVRGQTVGKFAMRVRVVHVGTGASPGWRRSLHRFVVYYGPGLALCVLPLPRFVEGAVVIGWTLYLLVTMAADVERRGLHDWQAGTRVVRTASAPRRRKNG